MRTWFKMHIRDYQYANNLSYHNTYIPGCEMQIDFAGDKLYVQTGKVKGMPVVVLCCMLPFSGIGYAKPCIMQAWNTFSVACRMPAYFEMSEVCKATTR